MSLEKELLEKTNKDFCFLTRSGSVAIILALISSNIPKGSEILLPSLCCPAVLFAIQIAGFEYKLVDVDKTNFNINIENIKKAFSKKTSAIIAVHMYGIPCQVNEISFFCKENNLILIEDSCLIFPSSNKNNYQILNNNADFSIISFGYDKPISVNYGGAIFTKSKIYQKRILQNLKNNTFFGFIENKLLKDKISEKLSQISTQNEKRIENIKFIESIINKKYLINDQLLSKFSLWRYPIILQNIDQKFFIEKLKEKGLIVTTHYQSLSKLSYSASNPNSEYIAEHIINIFIQPNVDKKDIKSKIEFLNSLTK